MSEFNQRVSAVAREVIEQGETIQVTNRGRAVLRVVPERESAEGTAERLIAEGLASGPTRKLRPMAHRQPVPLSRGIDELLAETSGDIEF